MSIFFRKTLFLERFFLLATAALGTYTGEKFGICARMYRTAPFTYPCLKLMFDVCLCVCVFFCGTSEACQLPVVKGACDGYYPSWYYNRERSRCEQFIYGGCLGNGNRFSTAEECQETCVIPETMGECQETCVIPETRGECQQACVISEIMGECQQACVISEIMGECQRTV